MVCSGADPEFLNGYSVLLFIFYVKWLLFIYFGRFWWVEPTQSTPPPPESAPGVVDLFLKN